MNAIALSQPTNPLINVFNTIIDGVNQLAVNARDLHSFLKVGRDFSTWIKNRIEQYVFIENVDYILTLTKTGERKNVVMTEYYLALDMAKELAMVENNEEGRKVRRYFIRCEHDLYKSDSEKRKILVAACTKLSAGNMPIDEVYRMVGGQFGYNNVVDIPTPLLPEAIAFVYETILRLKPIMNNGLDEATKSQLHSMVAQTCVSRAWFLAVKEPLSMLNPKIVENISTVFAWNAMTAKVINQSLSLGVDVDGIMGRDWRKDFLIAS